jgi:DNA-binding MarR family transcriptional regulator
MSELASILGVEKAAITGLVDRIERRGLVQRTGVPGDRRACHVRLTPTGESKALAAHQDILRALNRLVYGISPTEQRQLRQTVLHLTERASTQRS